jgi:CheY-like chemotaxis protein
VVSVRDDGSGIDPENLDRIFELFAQGRPSLDRRQGGLGLGLTLARRLAELHGGTLEATSPGAGRGSEFVLRIPVAPEDRAAAPIPAAVPEARSARVTGRGRRVLVVDDNADAREALQYLLEEDGHEVTSAGDGPAAIEEARRSRPEVVLLDIGLPGMDGYEVARVLRTEPGCRGALIVAVSGYGQADDRARSRLAGFDQHLLKPVSPERLLEVVRESMPKAG